MNPAASPRAIDSLSRPLARARYWIEGRLFSFGARLIRVGPVGWLPPPHLDYRMRDGLYTLLTAYGETVTRSVRNARRGCMHARGGISVTGWCDGISTGRNGEGSRPRNSGGRCNDRALKLEREALKLSLRVTGCALLLLTLALSPDQAVTLRRGQVACVAADHKSVALCGACGVRLCVVACVAAARRRRHTQRAALSLSNLYAARYM